MNRAAVRDAFRQQSTACAKLGSPFMARLMGMLAERLSPGNAVADRVLDWIGDPRPQADSVPLRLAGALHALKIGGKALSHVYPPNVVNEEQLWLAISGAFETHGDQLIEWLKEAPQTNEVRRSSAILPALAVANDLFPVQFDLLELGTSGGLNLRADQFLLQTPNWSIGPSDSQVCLSPDWKGAAPQTKLPTINRRLGVDINPLDPLSSDDQLRLLAYLWPDQPDRIDRTISAMRIAKAKAAEISKDDAGRWLQRELAGPPDRVGRFVFHTVAAQYFPDKTREIIECTMNDAGQRATQEAPLVRFQMEADARDHGAGMTLTIWPGGETHYLGRADFHGRWIEWTGL